MATVEQVIAAVNSLWPSNPVSGTDPLWHAALGPLTAEQRARGVRKLALREDRFRPKPGNVRAMCGPRAAEREAPSPPRDFSPRTQAWRSCQSFLAKRLMAGGPGAEPDGVAKLVEAERHVGGLDCWIVAEAVEIDYAERLRLVNAGDFGIGAGGRIIGGVAAFDAEAFRRLETLFNDEWESQHG